jgi:hypothetical protein
VFGATDVTACSVVWPEAWPSAIRATPSTFTSPETGKGTLHEGELKFTFHGEKSTLRAGSTLNIPANAPHSFINKSGRRRASSACGTRGSSMGEQHL